MSIFSYLGGLELQVPDIGNSDICKTYLVTHVRQEHNIIILKLNQAKLASTTTNMSLQKGHFNKNRKIQAQNQSFKVIKFSLIKTHYNWCYFLYLFGMVKVCHSHKIWKPLSETIKMGMSSLKAHYLVAYVLPGGEESSPEIPSGASTSTQTLIPP